jgi:hypothetical protein
MAPEGPQITATDVKGKKKAKSKKRTGSSAAGNAPATASGGKDPLEIAYGPIVGTNPQITEDDFEVNTEHGIHKPLDHDQGYGRHIPPPPEDEGPWARSDDNSNTDGVNYRVAEGLQEDDVWRR